jgi:hypothetical protein
MSKHTPPCHCEARAYPHRRDAQCEALANDIPSWALDVDQDSGERYVGHQAREWLRANAEDE